MTSCLIPFYNEKERISLVVGAALKIKTISQIICVDDGSQDGGGDFLRQNFPQVIVLRLENNLGKAGAVFSGLDLVDNEITMLLDGDLIGLDPEELDKICAAFMRNNFFDMVILKPRGEFLYGPIDWIFRNYVIQSGNRILSTKDLKGVKKLNPRGYQLEVAINQYMIDNRKNVAYIPISGLNLHKSSKTSFFHGFQKDIRMNKEINNYLGIWKHFWQILFFARRKLVK